mmetsp:Transcript_56570/g.99409  ORF Transcript_56570/g.99409 Transcript_56570/m.99409 type:complete len:248 (+) Transcript_56570:53-796(+)
MLQPSCHHVLSILARLVRYVQRPLLAVRARLACGKCTGGDLRLHLVQHLVLADLVSESLVDRDAVPPRQHVVVRQVRGQVECLHHIRDDEGRGARHTCIPVYEDAPTSAEDQVQQLLHGREKPDDVLEGVVSAFEDLVVDKLRVLRHNNAGLLRAPHDKRVGDIRALEELLVAGRPEGSEPEARHNFLRLALLRIRPVCVGLQQPRDALQRRGVHRAPRQRIARLRPSTSGPSAMRRGGCCRDPGPP